MNEICPALGSSMFMSCERVSRQSWIAMLIGKVVPFQDIGPTERLHLIRKSSETGLGPTAHLTALRSGRRQISSSSLLLQVKLAISACYLPRVSTSYKGRLIRRHSASAYGYAMFSPLLPEPNRRPLSSSSTVASIPPSRRFSAETLKSCAPTHQKPRRWRHRIHDGRVSCTTTCKFLNCKLP